MDSLFNKQRQIVPKIGKLGKLSSIDLKRILLKTIEEDGCWIWNGTIQDSKKGHQHGVIWFQKKYVQVHRIMFHNFIQDVPEYTRDGLIVLHKCSHKNNGRCINPWHLKLGTHKENSQDALKDGTLNVLKPNENNHMSKLSNSQVQEVRDLKGTGLKNEMFNRRTFRD
jgi:hypothetical protein